jgi:2-polyprenyl-3-methyl-5-hydroxy-6-metoxy-1,4-benzoquinol methylase
LVGAADVVFSSGVLEHFTDTAGCVAAMAAYVKPGGLVISSVPNMAGLTGSLQRIFDRETYDIHVPLDLSQLVDAHKDAGLLVQRSEYVLFANVGVVAIKSKARELRTLAKRASLGVAARINMILWLLEGPDGRLPPNPWTSPYILCVARKPSARE